MSIGANAELIKVDSGGRGKFISGLNPTDLQGDGTSKQIGIVVAGTYK